MELFGWDAIMLERIGLCFGYVGRPVSRQKRLDSIGVPAGPFRSGVEKLGVIRVKKSQNLPGARSSPEFFSWQGVFVGFQGRRNVKP